MFIFSFLCFAPSRRTAKRHRAAGKCRKSTRSQSRPARWKKWGTPASSWGTMTKVWQAQTHREKPPQEKKVWGHRTETKVGSSDWDLVSKKRRYSEFVLVLALLFAILLLARSFLNDYFLSYQLPPVHSLTRRSCTALLRPFLRRAPTAEILRIWAAMRWGQTPPVEVWRKEGRKEGRQEIEKWLAVSPKRE